MWEVVCRTERRGSGGGVGVGREPGAGGGGEDGAVVLPQNGLPFTRGSRKNSCVDGEPGHVYTWDQGDAGLQEAVHHLGQPPQQDGW